MDPKVAKKTQDTLGKIIKKPPLTEKLLGKPPFRFLHDIMTSVIKTNGFMKGLFTDTEMNSENVKDRDSKVAFLQKAIDIVVLATGKSLSVKPAKVVAGHEPEKTNEFLQALAAAINAKGDNEEYVNKVLGKSKGGSDEKKEDRDRSREKSGDRRKRDEEKKDREKSHDRDRGKERERSRDKDREERHKDREDRHKDREDRHKDREDRHKDRDRDRERDKDKDRKSGRRRRDESSEGKENETPNSEMMNGEMEQRDAPSARLQRPTSAKGSRRRHEGLQESSDEDVPVQKQPETTTTMIGDDDLPPQVAASRKMNRPSSARPAPPRRKEDTVTSEPAMRLGSGKPANLIIDDGDENSDEDETFVVEETAPPPTDIHQETLRADEDLDEDDHGGLVKKIMETKKEYETPQARKREIEKPTISDAQRRKQREQVQKEIDKLRSSIQTLTRSANPLGKIMDYVQEDLDSMQKELEKWKNENKEHAQSLKRETAITERAIEPLKAQLTDVDQAIKDQLDLIGAVKSNIMKNDQKIEKMLRTIAKS